MPEADISLARLWIRKAKSDLLNVDNNMAAERVPFDTVCFHCQQAAEKCSALLAGDVVYPVTNDLPALLEVAIQLDPAVDSLREDLAFLTPFAVEIRYPDDDFEPSREGAEFARSAAARVFDWCRGRFPEVF